MGEILACDRKIEEFRASVDGVEPLVMINLFRFRKEAAYEPGANHAPCSGREAFSRYGAAVSPLLAAVGGRSIWSGSVLSSLIAPVDEVWDFATLMEYPSAAALINMSDMTEYKAAAAHRTAALYDSRLIVTRPNQPL